MKGTAALYKSCRSSLDAQLERFEKFALETCLHIPSDMVDREVRGVDRGFRKMHLKKNTP